MAQIFRHFCFMKRHSCLKAFFLIMLLAAHGLPVLAQESETPDLPPIDESEFNDGQGLPDFGPEPDYYDESAGEMGQITTAVIEGVQISGEPGERPDEKVISAYFIFRDKPSSYFYEVKVKEKKIIFEFNDTKTSGAPVPSVAEPPIKGFTVEDRKINVNKDIKGLKPEYHSQIRVVFNVDAVPKIHVSDEFNVISFTYKWTTDSTLLNNYVIKPPKKWPWYAGSGVALGCGGFAYWWFTRPPEQEQPKDLPINDLPQHIHQ